MPLQGSQPSGLGEVEREDSGGGPMGGWCPGARQNSQSRSWDWVHDMGDMANMWSPGARLDTILTSCHKIPGIKEFHLIKFYPIYTSKTCV